MGDTGEAACWALLMVPGGTRRFQAFEGLTWQREAFRATCSRSRQLSNAVDCSVRSCAFTCWGRPDSPRVTGWIKGECRDQLTASERPLSSLRSADSRTGLSDPLQTAYRLQPCSSTSSRLTNAQVRPSGHPFGATIH